MAFAVGHRTQAGAVEYANALQRIVSNGGAIGEVPRGRRVVGGIGGGSKLEYNGFFKIMLVEDSVSSNGRQLYRVKIVDGATYNPETGESGSMLCRINDEYVSVPPYTSSASIFGGWFAYLDIGEYDIHNGWKVSVAAVPQDEMENPVWSVRLGYTSIYDGLPEVRQEFTDNILVVTINK